MPVVSSVEERKRQNPRKEQEQEKEARAEARSNDAPNPAPRNDAPRAPRCSRSAAAAELTRAAAACCCGVIAAPQCPSSVPITLLADTLSQLLEFRALR